MRRKITLGILAALALLASGFGMGYFVGRVQRDPDWWAILVKNGQGDKATWFNLHQSGQAEAMRKEEDRLKSLGTKYHIAKGRIVGSLQPEPQNDYVDAHR